MKRSHISTLAILALLALFAAPAWSQCPADTNGDDVVDNDDANIVAAAFSCDLAGCSTWDINGNGIVGDLDFAEVQGNLGPCPDRNDVDDNGVVDFSDLIAITVAMNAGETCRADLDHSRTIDARDTYLYWATVGGSADALPLAEADVDEDGVLSGPDSSEINLRQGEFCRFDVDADGDVDGDDFTSACVAAGFPPAIC